MARLIPNLIALQARNNQFQQDMEQSRFQEQQQNSRFAQRLAGERHVKDIEGLGLRNQAAQIEVQNLPERERRIALLQQGQIEGNTWQNRLRQQEAESFPAREQRASRFAEQQLENAGLQNRFQRSQLDRIPARQQQEDQAFVMEQKKRGIELENLGMQGRAGKMALDQAGFNYEFGNAKRNIAAQLARGQSIDTSGMNDAQYMAYRSLVPSPGSTEEVMSYYGSLAKKGYPVGNLFSYDEDMKPVDINVSTPEAVKFWRGYDEAVSSGVKPDAAFDAVAQKLGLDVNRFSMPKQETQAAKPDAKKEQERKKRDRSLAYTLSSIPPSSTAAAIEFAKAEERQTKAAEDRAAKEAGRNRLIRVQQ